MRRCRKQTWTSLTLMIAAAALIGCKSTAKHDNPVLQPPPRRVSMDDSEVETRIAQAGTAVPGIRQVSASNAGDDSQVYNARVVARVNGAPVFAGEVLDRYGDYLRKAREQLPPEEYQALREAIIRRDLRSHIERRLLVERMKSTMKPEQIKMLDMYVDRMFEERVEELKKELKVSTRTELELALNERNTTLRTVRDAFATERIAMEYLFGNIDRPDPPTRAELVAYYQQHLNDYKLPAKVKWEQIQVSTGRLTKSQAEAKIREARQELDNGVPFADVARKFSDGATARSGGDWDWVRKGSLADTDLEKRLFTQPVGEVSEVFFSRGAFHLVRVADRHEEGRVPFAEVQGAIEKKIQASREKDLPKQFVDKLYREAIIETEYDYLEDE